jgi:uncharacterized protein with NRDE domain
MCLILVAWQKHPEFPLVVAANRDEFHSRPAARAGFWQDKPAILAGRDLEAKGTWLGVSRTGRFAAVTNYRGGREASAIESRGLLVNRFLESGATPAEYAAEVVARGARYSGFNLLACDGEALWWCSNRNSGPLRLEPGLYGLGNFLLDTPEVNEPKARLERALEPGPAVETLFSILAESKLIGQEYGTRCATVLLKGHDGRLSFAERAFDAAGNDGRVVRFELGPRLCGEDSMRTSG